MKIFTTIKDLVIIALLIFFLWQWNKKKDDPGKTTTIIHHYIDSSQGRPIEINTRPGNIPVQVPVYITVPPTATMPGRVDTVYKDLDSLEIVKAFFTSHYYVDTTKTPFGDIVVKNKTFQNTLDSQLVIYNLKIPETIKTVSKGQVYLGLDLMGNSVSLLKGAGGNLAWKTKGNKMYQVGVLKIDKLPLLYSGGFKMLLHK